MYYRTRFTALLLLILLLCTHHLLGNIGEFAHNVSTNSVDSDLKTIHIIVALCDNDAQMIAPVSAKLGNGQNPADNLYWGAYYGVKSAFNRNTNWQLVLSQDKPETGILERCVFKHTSQNTYIVADAYNGNYIVDAVQDYLEVCAGVLSKTVHADNTLIPFGSSSHLIAYVGHNTLIENELTNFPNGEKSHRKAITLGCFSKKYFTDPIGLSGAYPLIWTTSTMAPEAYILEAIFQSWMNGSSNQQIREGAAKAYSKYQKTTFSSSYRLFETGW